MRIAGGEHCGRQLSVPEGIAVRPTQDRVRQALFNIIAGEVPGARFLDLFAGSGSVGLEALSRGAAAAVFVENNRRHLAVLRKNIAALLGERAAVAEVVCADVYRWIASGTQTGFDIAFADPPYVIGEKNGYAEVLNTLAGRNVVKVGGLFIAEMTADQAGEEVDGWEMLRDREYGKTRICIWRRKDLN